MTDQDQIAALNELAGWRLEKHHNQWDVEAMESRSWESWIGPDKDSGDEPPDWLKSRDASVELRLKVCAGKTERVLWLNHARVILHSRTKHASDFDVAGITPREDCEAILRATGKWKD
jgi:hypothetical protein